MDARKIYWTQGLFLAPQHFQQQDLYHEQRSYALSSLNRSANWGLVDLVLDADALRGSRLAIDKLVLLTPRGALIRAGRECTQPNAALPEISFADAFEKLGRGGKLDVHLVLAPHSPHTANIAESDAADEGGSVRFAVEQRLVGDYYLPDDNEQADIAYVNFALGFRFVARDPGVAGGPADRETVCLARIEPGMDGTPQIDESYIPPCLTVHAVPHLRRHLSRALNELEGRARTLARTMGQHGSAGGSLSVQNIWNTLTITTVNRLAAGLRTAYEDDRRHPADAYAALRDAVAVLSGFSIEHDLYGRTGDHDGQTASGAYDHQNLGPLFATAVNLVVELLKYLNPGPEIMIPLTYVEAHGRYGAELPTHFFEGRAKQYYLLVRSQIADADELRQQLTTVGKLADPQSMLEIVKRNLVALPLQYAQSVPPELVQAAQKFRVFYIALDEDSQRLWPQVEAQKRVELHSPMLNSRQTEVMIAKIAAED